MATRPCCQILLPAQLATIRQIASGESHSFPAPNLGWEMVAAPVYRGPKLPGRVANSPALFSHCIGLARTTTKYLVGDRHSIKKGTTGFLTVRFPHIPDLSGWPGASSNRVPQNMGIGHSHLISLHGQNPFQQGGILNYL